MIYQLVFSKGANQDILESIQWYNEQQAGLGIRFNQKLDEKLDKIASLPLSYSFRYKKIRCAKVDDFPYMVHYFVEETKVIITAVLHTSRNPRIWITKRKR